MNGWKKRVSRRDAEALRRKGPEDGRQRTEDGIQRTEDGKRWTAKAGWVDEYPS